ncbi:DUF4870 domain-containing protein [Brevibacterium senegalense]|uniref:DUF4870 domain-containing protein n=1 Tax=Brevibacterium senegalense TaxID=1033736 RepID=UPI00030FDF4D|nr:DUF4870 domain-containing protein [Brevibacterium senegalense]
MSVPPPHTGPHSHQPGPHSHQPGPQSHGQQPFGGPAAPPLRGPHPDAAYGTGSAQYWRSSQDDRSMAVLTHIGALLISAVVPLIMFLLKKDESAFIREQSRQSLNLQIMILIAGFVSGLLMFVIVGFILLPLVVIAAWVFQIIAAVKAYNGECYRMPFTFDFVR